jgi:hypothetical protein
MLPEPMLKEVVQKARDLDMEEVKRAVEAQNAAEQAASVDASVNSPAAEA